MGVNKTVSNLTIEDAVKKISKSKYRLHCLIIYPNLKTFREFYTHYIKRQIDLRNELTLFNPFYEAVGAVRQNLSLSQ
jgi:hypothetical protein